MMLAGREMDALVAEKVMGWDRVGVINTSGGLVTFDEFLPSVNIESAWDVVKMVGRDRSVAVWRPGPNRNWVCTISDGIQKITAEGPDAPLAICRCALKVYEIV